jgi:hypothetical protein
MNERRLSVEGVGVEEVLEADIAMLACLVLVL